MKNPTTKHKVSSKEVAKLAGVSQSTVSRAYNPSYNLDETLKQKVFEAAKQLGYRPNAIARSLLSNRTNIIGIVTSSLNSPFIASALNMFISKLQEEGFQSLVFVARHGEDIDTVLDRILSYRVDLLLIFGARNTNKITRICNENGTLAVLFNRYIPQSNTSAVCCNDYQCGRLVAADLYENGCRNFAYVSGFENVTTNIDRRNGYVSGLQELGIEHCQIVQGGYSYEEGLRAAKDMLAANPSVDACFCANDITAVGVLDYIIHYTNKSIPDDFSIVGFDDISMSGQLSYQLSTIHQPVEQMVDATIVTIREMLDNPSARPVLKMIEGEYIKRKTTK